MSAWFISSPRVHSLDASTKTLHLPSQAGIAKGLYPDIINPLQGQTEWYWLIVLTLLWLVCEPHWQSSLLRPSRVTSDGASDRIYARLRNWNRPRKPYFATPWLWPLTLDLKTQIDAFPTHARPWSPRAADGRVATRPSRLAAPEDRPPSRDVCSRKLPRPQGWKTHAPFFTAPKLSINTMSQTRRNLFFTTTEASSECRSADTNSCLGAEPGRTWSCSAAYVRCFRASDASCCHSATHHLIHAAEETYVLMWHGEHLRSALRSLLKFLLVRRRLKSWKGKCTLPPSCQHHAWIWKAAFINKFIISGKKLMWWNTFEFAPTSVTMNF